MIQFPLLGDGPGGGNQVVYFANNILYNTVAGNLYLSDGNGNAPTWAISVLTNNNYYGAGNGPSQDPQPVNANPQFVTAMALIFNCKPQARTSMPVIIQLLLLRKTLLVLSRSSTPSIGAYEYAGTSSFCLPVVAITSPSSGSSFTAGNNVTITCHCFRDQWNY